MTLIASMGGLYLMMQHAGDEGVEVNFTLDTLYLNWTTTFPGVTLCEEIATKFALRKFSALYRKYLLMVSECLQSLPHQSIYGIYQWISLIALYELQILIDTTIQRQ